MKVYHYMKERYGIDALKNKRLKVANLDSLNDPFEYFHMDTQQYVTRVVLKNRKNITRKKFGLLCFSGNYISPVQWAHYADSHKGICLGFEIPGEELLKIEYSENRTSISEFKAALDLDSLAFMKYMLSKKHKHWEYEEEYRMLIKFKQQNLDNSLVFEPFSERLILTEVILGTRCPFSVKKMKQTLCNIGHHDVSISKVVLSETCYSMKKNEVHD